MIRVYKIQHNRKMPPCPGCGDFHESRVAESECAFNANGVGTALTQDEVNEFLQYCELNADIIE